MTRRMSEAKEIQEGLIETEPTTSFFCQKRGCGYPLAQVGVRKSLSYPYMHKYACTKCSAPHYKKPTGSPEHFSPDAQVSMDRNMRPIKGAGTFVKGNIVLAR